MFDIFDIVGGFTFEMSILVSDPNDPDRRIAPHVIQGVRSHEEETPDVYQSSCLIVIEPDVVVNDAILTI